MPTYTTNYNLAKPLVNDVADQDLWGGELNSNMDIIDSAMAALVPAGVMVSFAGSTAPSGWLLCYGQAVNRVTYAALFTAIGTLWGVGDGSTTFNLPDLRGRIPAGQDNMGGSAASRITNFSATTVGATGGSQNHTLTTAELAVHTHAVTDAGHSHAASSGALVATAGTGGVAVGSGASVLYSSGVASATTGITVDNAGSGSAHNNIQPTAIVTWIIKT